MKNDGSAPSAQTDVTIRRLAPLTASLTAAALVGTATIPAFGQVEGFSLEGSGEASAMYPDAVAYRGDSTALRRVFEKAERGETVRVAAIGGSITEGAAAGGEEYRWATLFANGWRELFPKARIEFLSAGVGATGSLIGAFRYALDVSPFKPDVLAVDFSVNDDDNDESRQTMEGLIRHAMREGAAVILLGMTCGNGASAQAAHIEAARKYGVPFVSYRDAVMPRIKSGDLTWADIGADNIHPNRRGHAIAGELVNLFVRDELRRHEAARGDGNPAGPFPSVPSPDVTDPFETGSFTPFSKVPLTENRGFSPYKEDRPGWGEGLMSTNAGDRVAFTFTGSSAVLLYRRGNLPCGLGRARIVVDGVELTERPLGYAKGMTWWKTPPIWLCRGKPGGHTVEIETLPAENPGDPVGFRLAVLMVN